jgi:hypothetical protein
VLTVDDILMLVSLIIAITGMGVAFFWRNKLNRPSDRDAAAEHDAAYRWDDEKLRFPEYKYRRASESGYQSDERNYRWNGDRHIEPAGVRKSRIRGLSDMHELSNDERNLLRHYAEDDRVIGGLQRTPAHQHLLRIGYIREQSVDIQDLLIIVTDAGRRALRSAS